MRWIFPERYRKIIYSQKHLKDFGDNLYVIKSWLEKKPSSGCILYGAPGTGKTTNGRRV